VCRAGESCTGGRCTCTDPGEDETYLWCDVGDEFDCIPAVDDFNCGDCGNECIGNSRCETSVSGPSADDYRCVCKGSGSAGKTHCPGDGCTDLDDDTDNCGECGNDCDSGDLCCDGECADLDYDEDHCGECGNDCNSGQLCCGGTCVNPNSNRDNCGSCGEECEDIDLHQREQQHHLGRHPLPVVILDVLPPELRVVHVSQGLWRRFIPLHPVFAPRERSGFEIHLTIPLDEEVVILLES
jgi:hypothetical protein